MKNNCPLISMKVTLLICLLSLFAAAQSPDRSSSRQLNGQPITSILNPDGSIKRGISGSFDSKGFRMANGPDGSPRFVAETAASSLLSPADCTDGWDDRFWTVGLGGGYFNNVYAMASDGAGNIYVGGSFVTADNAFISAIAKWDGSRWSALGTGLGNEPWSYYPPRVFAIAVSGSDVYVGGIFTSAGGVPANNIAKWDGSSWSPLGSGTDQHVNGIAIAGSDVYAGGGFDTAGGVPASRIAKWNGSSWSSLGSGVRGNYSWWVKAIAVSGTDVYVGGFFNEAGSVPANNIAKWNGTNWSPLGSGSSQVYALALSGTDVYVGGAGIAKWNGTDWSALGPGLGNGNSGTDIYGIAVSGSDVYAVGYFQTAGEVGMKGIAKWNGSAWSALGTGISNEYGYGVANVVAVSGSSVYVGGDFISAGGVSANRFAKWNGSSWSAPGLGTGSGVARPGSVAAVAVAGNGDVYIGGEFKRVGGLPVNNIAKWDGRGWTALGDGINGRVLAITVWGTDVYAGGIFSQAGTVFAQSIAKWDGSSWSALGYGVDDSTFWGVVSAIAASDTGIYAGGFFSSAGTVEANNIAKWNGSSWSALGSGVELSGVSGQGVRVLAIAVAGADVYVGGRFNRAGGGTVKNIAKWNGSNWSDMGGGLTLFYYTDCPGDGCSEAIGSVNAIAVSGSDVYAGGQITAAGSTPVNSIAKWDGESWAPVGQGVTLDSGPWNYASVMTIAISGPDVNVGGIFQRSGSITTNNIAKWNGSSWSSVGSGVRGDVSALAFAGPNLYVGGLFSSAGCHPASNFSRYTIHSSAPFDFDGDGRSDISVFRPSDNTWYLNRSQLGFTAFQFGAFSDVLTPADFTGDGKTDIAVFRPSAGNWYILRSEDNTYYASGLGTNGDIPAPGDYDGDGKADVAVYRPSQGTWYLQRSNAGASTIQFGIAEDKPAVGDFDGDGKADVSLYRPSTGDWYRLNSSNGVFFAAQFGAAGDKIVPSDYTGDGKTDIAVWRPSNGFWYVLKSEDLTFYGSQFGLATDLPAPGDYDGDGKADMAVFRPSEGIWYLLNSTTGFSAMHFGASEDRPAPGAFVY